MQALVLTFIIPATALIFAAVFVGLWWQDRSRVHVAAYAYCYAALGAGVMINIFILQAVTPFGIVAYHLLSMSGLIALLWGTAHRVGLKTPIRAYTASVVFTAGILWAAISAGERDAMMMAQNINSSLLMALAAQNLWHAGSRRLGDRAVVWTLALFSTFGFIRPLLTVFSDTLFGPGEEGAALLLAVHVLVLAVFLTLQALALIATVVSDSSASEREVAAIDPLSGLPMRAMFEREALALKERARERGVAVSVVIADLDHFKRINDTHGHAAGDRVISTFGSLLAGEIRPHDICGRIGGEEFCIIAYKCEGDQAQSLANRLRAATNRMMVPWNTQELGVTASFGVAQWDAHESYSDVFKRADAALYSAKRAGRDCVIRSGEDSLPEAQGEIEAVETTKPGQKPDAAAA
ncbi:MAG: GGDEF domain-containing protein [Erythrobacter sp.]|uniref:GGDEF domain-containing protein n=1 Tax=Erythrobacter sp. TaxID=1042 RepID=UPI002623EA4F|nr:GGDEF domain-containing protein [Erythrobacter sp.]MDJ0977110.1 GGDEF domain-containing protein [Erythrobacter sp.]